MKPSLSQPPSLSGETAPARAGRAPVLVIDSVPQRTCVALVGIACAIIALSVWWSWRMACAQLPAHAAPVVVPVADLGIQVGLFPPAALQQRPDPPAGYGWVDRRRGIVHVPIDVAMRIYLEKGRP